VGKVEHENPRWHENLCFEILKLAFKDARGRITDVEGNAASVAQHNAMQWFISDEFHICSFTWVCLVLDYDPKRIRCALASRR